MIGCCPHVHFNKYSQTVISLSIRKSSRFKVISKIAEFKERNLMDFNKQLGVKQIPWIQKSHNSLKKNFDKLIQQF